MAWIKNNFLPYLLVAIGMIANDTTLISGFLESLNAPIWLFTALKVIGSIWAAFKLFNAKSSKIKKEIEEALATDPNAVTNEQQGIIGGRPNEKP